MKILQLLSLDIPAWTPTRRMPAWMPIELYSKDLVAKKHDPFSGS
jgi:hypothetical protein